MGPLIAFKRRRCPPFLLPSVPSPSTILIHPSKGKECWKVTKLVDGAHAILRTPATHRGPTFLCVRPAVVDNGDRRLGGSEYDRIRVPHPVPHKSG
jgi:hypothetical protein